MTNDALAELRAVLARQNEQINAYKAAVSEAREAVATERDRFREETKDQREQSAEDDRKGENGKARQELQRRIDARQTTMQRVMRGVDTHWSAVQVRQEVEQGVDATIARLRVEDPQFAADMDRRTGQDGPR